MSNSLYRAKVIVIFLVILFHANFLFAQKTIKGNVSDSSGQGLFGVSISIKGTKNGTTTDKQGNFSVNVAAKSILEFSYIGYVSKSVTVTDQEFINVQLAAGTDQMNEVVVTALGIKRQEKSLGYAVQKVSGETLSTVKGVDVATSLTGRISGLVVKNTTEFFDQPSIELRGESALLVIDGVPYGNMTLRDVPTDDIDNIEVLKGGTASALYGNRGGSGAIIVTTKRGNKGFAINLNSTTMTQAGFLAIPKAQSSYGHGLNGVIGDDYVWGPKLDVGNTADQWNPVTKQIENMPLISSGKNNFKNFLERGVIASNSISVSMGSDSVSFRASLNDVYNKGQYPNAKLNMINFTMGGEIKAKKLTLEAHMGYSTRNSPQTWGSGYGNQGYIYQLLMWTGSDYDLRKYRDYWITPNQSQNWLYNNFYDNPYLIAHEKLNGIEQTTLNASFTGTYKFNKDLKFILRSGLDDYSNTTTQRNPAGIHSTRGGWNTKGLYGIYKSWGISTNTDAIITYHKKVSNWDFDALVGGTVYYYYDQALSASTQKGLSVPGYYSLNGSVDKPAVSGSLYKQQVNSLYGKLSIGWNDGVFLDLTGRNDHNSTQPSAVRSYLYPSAALSVLVSRFLKLPSYVDLWKLRGSWTVSKTPFGVYSDNRTYSTTNAAWNTFNSASYPSSLLGANLKPSAYRTWEFGTAAYFLKKRLHVDVAYYSKLFYNQQVQQSISNASGFSSTYITTQERTARRGIEITLDGAIIKNKKFAWESMINIATQHQYYVALDNIYSTDDPWTKKGARLDTYKGYYWLRDPKGNIIHDDGGQPIESDYVKKLGYGDPNFTFGFINNFYIGNFSIGLSIDGRIGGLMYDYVYDKMFDTGTNPATDNQYRHDEVVNGLTNYVGKGVKITGGSVDYDKYGNITNDTRTYATNDIATSYQQYARNFRGGDMGIQSETFVKVREVSIGYRLPYKNLSKTGLKSLSLALTAQNVFLFTKFKFSDPDLDTENLNSPSQRMIGANIKVGF